ncbi:MAG TPA: PIN domain-containing protein [Isosphaeraceae bacterium]|jgi:predicted nucleic acid-binding protein
MVDTNVLIYASDPVAGDKRTRAADLIRTLSEDGELAVSVQVLNEFYNVSTRPNKPPALTHEDAKQIVQDLAEVSDVLPLTSAVTFRALDAIPRHGLSFWDALIWAAARENGVAVIYTEDFQHGRDVDGVRFLNPFADGR